MSGPGALQLKWYARTTDDTWPRRKTDVQATVEVYQEGEVVQTTKGSSQATVTLPSGSFVIYIQPDMDMDPARIGVKVGPPP
jgi:hypothetical protein